MVAREWIGLPGAVPACVPGDRLQRPGAVRAVDGGRHQRPGGEDGRLALDLDDGRHLPDRVVGHPAGVDLVQPLGLVLLVAADVDGRVVVGQQLSEPVGPAFHHPAVLIAVGGQDSSFDVVVGRSGHDVSVSVREASSSWSDVLQLARIFRASCDRESGSAV